MELEHARHSLKMVAQQAGTTEETVKTEIEVAIMEARANAYASGDKQKIAMWESIPRAGEIPTAEEFVEFMSAVAGLIAACEE